MNKHIVSTLITAFMAVSTFILAQPRPIKAGENIAVATTLYGKIRGYIDDGIYAFKGIPYAQADRFMPPQAPAKWDGVRQCNIFGPQAMQNKAQTWTGQSDNNFGFQFNVEPMDEKECFVLNIWSQGINDGKKRPVWVWIHGGGFAGGSANQLSFFDGWSLAKKGDIVVVSVNHRLNLLGYLDLRGLGGKYSESVNLGMQDLVAALRWVHNNIENFGGDPNTVTINGQSGGGGKVCTLLAMPSAVGLFQRAIVQSGSLEFKMNGEDSKTFGMAFASALGVTPENTEKLNIYTYDELINTGQIASNKLGSSGNSIMGRYCPTVDGKYVTQNPFDPVPAEFSKNVSLLVGSNLNEFTYPNRAIISPKTIEQVKLKMVQNLGEGNVEKLIALYKRAYPSDDQPQHILTFDSHLRYGAIKQATARSNNRDVPVYVYLFSWQSPVNDGSLGAAHGMELPFIFNNIAMAHTLTGGNKEAYELADKISSAWLNFVKTGNPNCKSLPRWEPFSSENGATMLLDNACRLVHNHDKELIDFVSSIPSPLFGAR